MSEFEQKVKDLVRFYFPDVECITSAPMTIEQQFGIYVKLTDTNSHRCFHFYARHTNEYQEDAELVVLDRICDLQFFKVPKVIYWRNIETSKRHIFETGDTEYTACARFTLGY